MVQNRPMGYENSCAMGWEGAQAGSSGPPEAPVSLAPRRLRGALREQGLELRVGGVRAASLAGANGSHYPIPTCSAYSAISPSSLILARSSPSAYKMLAMGGKVIVTPPLFFFNTDTH